MCERVSSLGHSLLSPMVVVLTTVGPHRIPLPSASHATSAVCAGLKEPSVSRFRAQSAQEEVRSAGIQTGKAASVEGCITSRTRLARLHRLWRLSLSVFGHALVEANYFLLPMPSPEAVHVTRHGPELTITAPEMSSLASAPWSYVMVRESLAYTRQHGK